MTIKLVVKNDKEDTGSTAKTLSLEDLLITIGSGATATVQLADAQIAPEQGVIINENGHPLFINRSKGTILNGEEIEQGIQQELKNGDRLVIGSYNLMVELENGHNSIEPEKNAEGAGQNGQALAAVGNNEVNSFADILSSLRQEEDQYYFQVNEPDGAKRRLLLEADEIVLGWNNEEKFFTSDKELIVDQPQASVRKDWSGVTIYPNGEEAILLNNALLEAGTRLKNGDKLVFSRRLIDVGAQSLEIVFCEPAALIELNAILPQELLTNALEITQTGEIKVDQDALDALGEQNEIAAVENQAEQQIKPRSPYYFGYFTRTEVIILTVGTILTTILTFILLELSS
jgi:hypothetical protein